jgi:hypothetical protein
MTIWQGVLIILGVVCAYPVMYGLYRVFLWMKRRGWLSLRNYRSGSSATSCFVALQQFIEPSVRHVQELKTQRRDTGSKDTPLTNESGAESA